MTVLTVSVIISGAGRSPVKETLMSEPPVNSILGDRPKRTIEKSAKRTHRSEAIK
jgi:hypothetical protein